VRTIKLPEFVSDEKAMYRKVREREELADGRDLSEKQNEILNRISQKLIGR